MKRIWTNEALCTLILAACVGTAQAQTFAYVTHPFNDYVSVIATDTNSIVATVPVGQGPQLVAVTPDRAFAYVANAGSNTASVIRTADNTVSTTVENLNSEACGVATTPDGRFAYVTATDNVAMGGHLYVIATASNTVVATIPWAGHNPCGIAITPDGAYAYVANTGSGTVSVIRLADNTWVKTIANVAAAGFVAITPDGASVYVTSSTLNRVYVIATASNTIQATLSVGVQPYGVALTPDGAFAYVANTEPNQPSGTVSVIATSTNDVVATIPVGSWPFGVAITPDGAFVYVTNRYSNSVSVIATAGNTVVATVLVDSFPGHVAISPQRQTPERAITALKGQVDALVAAGALSVGNGRALNAKLDAALAQLNRSADTGATSPMLATPAAASGASRTAAIGQLNAFIYQANALVRSGLLSASQGQVLIDMASGILLSLSAT